MRVEKPLDTLRLHVAEKHMPTPHAPIAVTAILPLQDGFWAIVGDRYAFAQSFCVVLVEDCNPVLPKVVEMNN